MLMTDHTAIKYKNGGNPKVWSPSIKHIYQAIIKHMRVKISSIKECQSKFWTHKALKLEDEFHKLNYFKVILLKSQNRPTFLLGAVFWYYIQYRCTSVNYKAKQV